MAGISISKGMGLRETVGFSPSLSSLLSRPGGGGRLRVSGTGTATASAPSLGPGASEPSLQE